MTPLPRSSLLRRGPHNRPPAPQSPALGCMAACRACREDRGAAAAASASGCRSLLSALFDVQQARHRLGWFVCSTSQTASGTQKFAPRGSGAADLDSPRCPTVFLRCLTLQLWTVLFHRKSLASILYLVPSNTDCLPSDILLAYLCRDGGDVTVSETYAALGGDIMRRLLLLLPWVMTMQLRLHLPWIMTRQ